MNPINRIRPKIGDVIEIPTPKGFAYAQYTHDHTQFGALLRVFPGVHAQRPEDFSSLVQGKDQFQAFFPLSVACSRKIVSIASNESIPVASKKFPLFRAAGAREQGGKVLNWLLWDGEKQWRIDGLKPEHIHLPIRSIWNDTLLVERILQGWVSAQET